MRERLVHSHLHFLPRKLNMQRRENGRGNQSPLRFLANFKTGKMREKTTVCWVLSWVESEPHQLQSFKWLKTLFVGRTRSMKKSKLIIEKSSFQKVYFPHNWQISKFMYRFGVKRRTQRLLKFPKAIQNSILAKTQAKHPLILLRD